MIVGDIFNTIIYEPLYNALVFLVSVVPGAQVGVAVILLTLLVRTVLMPLSHKSVKAQRALRDIDPEIKKIRIKNKDSKEEQARQTMKLYKEHGINPFSGIFLVFIQLPLILGLYWVFWKGLQNGIFDQELLYSFIAIPENSSFAFFGADLRERSIIIGLLAGVTQYFQVNLAMPAVKDDKTKNKNEKSFADDFKKSMGTQMRYFFPIIIIFISLGLPSAVPLYWMTSNIYSIGHELLVKKEAKKITEMPILESKTP